MRNLQEHILQTASDLFYRHGVKATGIDTIIKASGVAKMSLYKYFPSKEALVLAYLQKTGAALLRRLQQELAQAAEPRQQLLAVFGMFAGIANDPGFRGCPFINAVAEFGDQPNPAQQAADEFYRQLLELLTGLAEQAGARQPDLLARQLSLLIAGAMASKQFNIQAGAFPTALTAAESLISVQLEPAA